LVCKIVSENQEIVPFSAFFSFFVCKVTKKYLYLHVISILIKVKSEKRHVKNELYQARKAEIAKRR